MKGSWLKQFKIGHFNEIKLAMIKQPEVSSLRPRQTELYATCQSRCYANYVITISLSLIKFVPAQDGDNWRCTDVEYATPNMIATSVDLVQKKPDDQHHSNSTVQ
jgi:hypothetical protein